MSVSRIYQAVPITEQAALCLDERASHHLARVLRVKVGDGVTLFNGEEGEYSAVITHIGKKQVTVKVEQFNSRTVESPLEIYLAQGIARGEKMDFIVQKAVELGVKKIIPLLTERGNVRFKEDRELKRLQHWQAVVVSACEQSGRNVLPVIQAPLELMKWLPTIQGQQGFILSPHVNKPLPATINRATPLILLIGPEGGLSEQEVAAAMQAGLQPLNLGPRVLRTETATLAAITALQCQFGDMK